MREVPGSNPGGGRGQKRGTGPWDRHQAAAQQRSRQLPAGQPAAPFAGVCASTLTPYAPEEPTLREKSRPSASHGLLHSASGPCRAARSACCTASTRSQSMHDWHHHRRDRLCCVVDRVPLKLNDLSLKESRDPSSHIRDWVRFPIVQAGICPDQT